MPEMPYGMALGLVETRGYAALIAASDAAAKQAYAEVMSIERASGGLVLITLVGDVASVQEAVDAAVREAQRVGELVSAHVIPRPDDSVWRLLGLKSAQSTAESIPATAPEDTKRSADRDGLDATPVRELRRKAREIDNIGMAGREISRASKAVLIKAIRKARGK
jgi:ethanolamine utilization protein EutM